MHSCPPLLVVLPPARLRLRIKTISLPSTHSCPPQTVSRVLNITLPEHVLMAKMLARRVCADCGKGYNVANIKEGDLDMPPLLPKPSDCDRCHGKPRLVIRDDDKAEVVEERMKIYRSQTAPLIDYYSAQGKLQDFAVKKGLDDTPRLMRELGIPPAEGEGAAKKAA